jgi:hypothetical protein
MIIERAFGVVSVTRNTLNQFATRLENSAIGTGKMHAVGMISQCLVAHPARHRATVLVLHEEANAVLFQVLVLEARKRHHSILFTSELPSSEVHEDCAPAVP